VETISRALESAAVRALLPRQELLALPLSVLANAPPQRGRVAAIRVATSASLASAQAHAQARATEHRLATRARLRRPTRVAEVMPVTVVTLAFHLLLTPDQHRRHRVAPMATAKVLVLADVAARRAAHVVRDVVADSPAVSARVAPRDALELARALRLDARQRAKAHALQQRMEERAVAHAAVDVQHRSRIHVAPRT
jgi:hypothetical protein